MRIREFLKEFLPLRESGDCTNVNFFKVGCLTSENHSSLALIPTMLRIHCGAGAVVRICGISGSVRYSSGSGLMNCSDEVTYTGNHT